MIRSYYPNDRTLLSRIVLLPKSIFVTRRLFTKQLLVFARSSIMNIHFDSFISPKKNESLSLKDHRFNRVFDCCVNILYHLDDIKDYLDKYSNILNGIAILDRTFLDMELLMPIFCSAALIGIHFKRPFLSLLLDPGTTYDTLLSAFPLVYKDLFTVNSENFLQTDKRVVSFIDDKWFESSLPKNCLCDYFQNCAVQFKKEIIQLLDITLSRLAEGFSKTKRCSFWFWT